QPVDLVYVTAGAQGVRAEDRPRPERAMACALLKSLGEELGLLRATHLDLPPDDGEDRLPLLLAEAGAAAEGAEVAYRGGHRYVRRLAPLPDTPTPVRQRPGDGFTLLTGGLGGVGGEVAAHLLRAPGTRLLILGRTPEDALGTGAGAPERGELLRRLSELGEVRYACADVTDERQVRAAVDAAAQAWGVELTSVLHLAGALVERPVGELDGETWRQALAAKAQGAWTLHRLTADHPVASFVTFSSVNGYFGGAMNAAYAAANAYLDALALYRRRLGLPAQSLAWSMWRERGVSRGYRLAALTEARGYRLLDVPAALRSFDLARALDEPHLLIGADRTAPWVRSHVAAPARQVRRPVARVGLSDGTDLGALYRAAADAARAAGLGDDWVLRSAGATGRREAGGPGEDVRQLESRLAEVWCGVLGRDRVGRDENFFDLGGNSLLLVTAQSAVNSAFGTDLTVVDLFAHPTVRDLARHLAARTGPAVAEPSPEPGTDAGRAAGPGAARPAEPAPSGLDRAKEQAQRQRAARARRTARHGKDRGHA
ncbi:SDR family NAD(P)-dependent oxidoreductase, partial [Streptomyces sp. NPDC001811]